MKTFIGTAGWTIPKQAQSEFLGEGTHLEKYARILNCVEINSSFYREHKPETYAKWAASTPKNFRFSVKLSRYFTQEARLRETGSRLKDVLSGISSLQEKWGVLLVQLPPSLNFDTEVAHRFLADLRNLYSGHVLWEPRHQSWATEDAIATLAEFNINKVMADPEPCPAPAAKRSILEKIRYFRLHGSPEIYKSAYSPDVLQKIAKTILDPAKTATETWCIFDNTTFGFATENALDLLFKVQDVAADKDESPKDPSSFPQCPA